MPVVEAENLSKRFGRNAVLQKVDLAVESGEIFGLIGPSGSGKSTLIRTLTGYYPPSGGGVRLFGEDPASFGPDERRRIGFMPQGFVLYPQLSVRRNLSFIAGIYGLGLRERRRRVREVLQFVELWDARRRRAANVSGGMQRRLQLAAAMVHRPELMFVDEPTANLDPILRNKLWERFEALRDEGKAIIVSTQYVEEAGRCDRVGLLSGGRMIAAGTPRELLRQAFGGEIVRLELGGDIGRAGGYLQALERLGHVSDINRFSAGGKTKTIIRLIVDDADPVLPEVFRALQGAEVLAADVHTPSFDEVFVRLEERAGEAG
ncbi:MAG: ABC transporter ATP-binding protein [Rubrobacteraceae bacterium]|uniref:ABC transporter ATP-binding protein n=1 Tax=Rubrobacter naiadicus TaxID=1392641 RepID=UPI00235F34BF|nr:ABC transporter ATP-binding protein [Rubrobacter naiadicus]MBX6762944.1 ABC transporter ATP-binding protein [Rubrobacteraceae bacterium]MCL6438489.1 ABC transporter ATP-binding protein [Rubrobacteraceae bacterium]